MLVYGDLKHPEELPLLEGQGVELKHICDVLDELRNLKDTRTSSEASGVAELLEICCEEHRETSAKRPEALESEYAEQPYSLVEGGRLEPGMLVLNLRGNARDGFVPEGDDVVEEITDITPASDSHSQGYVKLHLEALEGGTTRTKYLSMAKVGGQYKGGKTQSRIPPAGGIATGKPSIPANEIEATFERNV
jgi:hypothetical protein